MRRIRGTIGTIVLSAGVGFASLSALAAPAGAAVPTCRTVSIATLDAVLHIQAAHVNTHHPVSPPGALMCSYYGNFGRAANQVTISYIRANAREFAGIEAGNARTHTIEKVSATEYGFFASPNQFVYRLDGPYQVQIFGTMSFGRMRKLAALIPSLT